MHSLIIIILTSLVLLLQILGVQLPFSMVAAGLAIGVLLIGLPHGGLDQKIGLSLFSKFPRHIALPMFLASYLLIAAVVILGWVIAPMVTILAFFGLSAWHFGLEEETRERFTMVQRLSIIARGGMVIWIPAYFQGSVVADLITLILPAGDSFVAEQVVSVIQICSPIALGLLIFDLISAGGIASQPTFALSPKYLHRIRVFAFAVLFATVDPLVSFGVYFCGWHSIRGLAHLRDQFQLTNRDLAWNLLPISSVAIALFAVGFLVSSSVNLIAPALVQTVFIGLSAVAVPHLLLHIVTDSIGTKVQGAIS